MKNMLDSQQQALVQEHLPIVHSVLRYKIFSNEQQYGMEYDDLYQEGCVWLCKAALTFNNSKGTLFKTYAEKVVTNGLYTYCRLLRGKQKHIASPPAGSDQESPVDLLPDTDWVTDLIARADIQVLFALAKQQNCKTVQLGIEAINWKLKGLSGTESAKLYGVRPNVVGAWISRAVKRLKEMKQFDTYLPDAG